jgi:Protein of unknown function (DUF2835)
VQLAIPADEMLRLYTGSAREVVARAENGKVVRFPGNILRSELNHDGVYGRFQIVFTADGKFQRISRLD